MLTPTPYTTGDARPARRRLRSPSLELAVRHRSESSWWEEYPGIETWEFSAHLTYSLSGDLPSVFVARAAMCRVDCMQCDFGDLDMISPDLGVIASAIYERAELMADHGIVEGSAGVLMIAADVVVHRFWRGHRIGPALVLQAADMFAANGVLLIPAALATRIGDTGECCTAYDLPRKGPAALSKVKTAWRRAGFRKLYDDVMWRPRPTGGGEKTDGSVARSYFRALEELATEPRAKAWWRHRAHCHPDNRTTLDRDVAPRRHKSRR